MHTHIYICINIYVGTYAYIFVYKNIHIDPLYANRFAVFWSGINKQGRWGATLAAFETAAVAAITSTKDKAKTK